MVLSVFESVEFLVLVQIIGLDILALNWTGHVGVGFSVLVFLFEEDWTSQINCLHLFWHYDDNFSRSTSILELNDDSM